MPKVIICGAGLVGALNACFFARRGWDVEVYEFRDDIRQMEHVPGRSINLALSCRGKSALEAVGLKDYIVEQGVKMYARLVHNQDGKTTNRQPYGQPGEHIVSINRRHLNEVMITQAEEYDNVKFFFQHKVRRMDMKLGVVIVENFLTAEELFVNGDLILACDGAHSAIRRSLMAFPQFNFSQEYIKHGYIELNILPKDDKFALEPNVFHLWPRGDFTVIALANTDKTFTTTLFAPFELFEKRMGNDKDVVQFFSEYFPDALKHIGEPALLETFNRVKPQTLISVKCEPHAFAGKVLLMGDAAHAMVPFYGQGMNCGFEDCLVLSEILDQCKDDVALTLKTYSTQRCRDARTIIDLAMYNYQELKDLVNRKSYKLRKKFDLFLNKWMPNTWVPLYSMVTFTRTPYHEVVEIRKWQDQVLRRTFNVTLLAAAVGGAFSVAKHFKLF
ncbi:hypothetical protein QR680_013925 [Steinernema hermaphroditum]|uniref:Kynurenine 3-monooxygenase n=1 Tax=Steinernema hermaphroditum TaxID=289476 RepID=A0AA39I9G1_9BILA|nr:hypothetical protein QR680_013925 [Steinernema hermaphroditum]